MQTIGFSPTRFRAGVGDAAKDGRRVLLALLVSAKSAEASAGKMELDGKFTAAGMDERLRARLLEGGGGGGGIGNGP